MQCQHVHDRPGSNDQQAALMLIGLSQSLFSVPPTCSAAASFLRRAMRRCTSSLGHSRLQQCCRPDGCTLKRMLTRCRAAVAAASKLSCRMAMVVMDSLQWQQKSNSSSRQTTGWHATSSTGQAAAFCCKHHSEEPLPAPAAQEQPNLSNNGVDMASSLPLTT